MKEMSKHPKKKVQGKLLFLLGTFATCLLVSNVSFPNQLHNFSFPLFSTSTAFSE
jgi:hypothetical protein